MASCTFQFNLGIKGFREFPQFDDVAVSALREPLAPVDYKKLVEIFCIGTTNGLYEVIIPDFSLPECFSTPFLIC